MNVLELKNVCKIYGNNKVLDNFSLNVKEGEIVSILGPSGIGKSTILRCINQLEEIDSGEIFVCGKSINNKSFAKEKIGIVFQEYNLFPNFTVLENVMLPIKYNLKVNEKLAKENAMKLLTNMRLEKRKDAYPCELSGGEKQRTAIARTLAVSPKVICFDEPTSALDKNLIIEIEKIIRKLSKEKKAILIVTHDMEFADRISNKSIKIS